MRNNEFLGLSISGTRENPFATFRVLSGAAAWIRRTALILVLLALNACATVQGMANLEHGLSVANKGDSKIFDVVIRYGNITRKDCAGGCLPKSEGGLWNSPMPIPHDMVVTWQTADGQQHQAQVPVKSRLKDPRRLRTLYFEFTGNRLVVVQGLAYDNPSLAGHELIQLFP